VFVLQFDPQLFEEYASRYSDDDGAIEQVVAPRTKEQGHMAMEDFLTLCHWKSPRARKHYQSNSADWVAEATRIALTTEHEELRIGVLTLLSGVQVPTASAFLHFCHSDPYPILDVRALWSLGVEQSSPSYSFEFWWKYVETCRELARVHGVSMRTLDRALWQYSKEMQ